MFDRVSGEVRSILASAEDEAKALGASAVEPEHLLLGIMQLDGPLAAMLRACGLNLEAMRRFLTVGDPSVRALPFSGFTRRTLERSLREALRRESNFIVAEHLFLACLVDEDGAVASILHSTGCSPQALRLMAGCRSPSRGPEPTSSQVVSLLEDAFGPVPVEHEGVR